MKIKAVESTMVRPISTTPTTRLWLSNLDVQSLQPYYSPLLYFFRPTGAANFFDAAVLKAALSRALVVFYPIAGRLEVRDDCMEINCNGEGSLFVEAEADGDMDDVGKFAAPPRGVTLVPAVSHSEDISTLPLFMTQVTRFKCGGVCLGIMYEHHLSDGRATFSFIKTWSDMAHGLDTTAVLPIFDRTILKSRQPPEPKFPHIEYLPPPQLLHKASEPINDRKKFATFKLTSAQLSALKAKCKQHEEENYTTFEVFTAHLWRCVSIARGLSENQETNLYVAVDGRSRLQPPVPWGYFGNVTFKGTAVALAGELARSGSPRKIREALVRMDDKYLRSTLDYLEVQGSLNAHARSTTLGSPNLWVVSWARLALYDADFGWGKVAYVRQALAPPAGKAYILPGENHDDGGLVCAITLLEDEMQLFEKLLYDI